MDLNPRNRVVQTDWRRGLRGPVGTFCDEEMVRWRRPPISRHKAVVQRALVNVATTKAASAAAKHAGTFGLRGQSLRTG